MQAAPVYRLGSLVPQIAGDAWIAPSAAVIGDVAIGAGSSVWFGAVLRGDINRIRVGARSNIQDNAVLHVASGPEFGCIVGDDVTIGHAAIIHACELRHGAFVGMGATVLNGAVIEPGGVLGAGALLTGGKRVGPDELWAGTPARFVRVLSAEQRAEFTFMTERYVRTAARFRDELQVV